MDALRLEQLPGYAARCSGSESASDAVEVEDDRLNRHPASSRAHGITSHEDTKAQENF